MKTLHLAGYMCISYAQGVATPVMGTFALKEQWSIDLAEEQDDYLRTWEDYQKQDKYKVERVIIKLSIHSNDSNNL
jgi:hypothetical protein